MFFCSIITISLLCALVAFFEEKLSNFKWWIWGLLCFLLIIVATFRPLGMDNDSIAYEIYYYNFDNPRSVLTVEYSFRVISEFIYNYFHNYRYLFLLYALLGTTIKFYSIKKLSPLPFLSVCIYIFTYYVVHEFTQIRAGVASAFLLLSLIPLSKGNKSLTLVVILFASLFHYSSLLMSILLCFDNKTMSKKNENPHRDLIAKDLMTSKYRQRIVPNKKKKLKKFDWKKMKDDSKAILLFLVVLLSSFLVTAMKLVGWLYLVFCVTHDYLWHCLKAGK